jgi:hypothetical protein
MKTMITNNPKPADPAGFFVTGKRRSGEPSAVKNSHGCRLASLLRSRQPLLLLL